MSWLWPWPRPREAPPPVSPAASRERALTISRAADEWDIRRRAVRQLEAEIQAYELALEEHQAELAQALREEAMAHARLEEASRGA